MCGIAGYLSLDNSSVDAELVKRMATTLTHRGPDDDGYFIRDDVGFGFRRLSIIDVLGGHQPLFNERKDLVLMFNGEIYNHTELRAELRAKGHVFNSGSDGEPILHLYEEVGDACLQHLRGMFAVALFDIRRRRLLLARDRIGIKPLYYAILPDGLRFASEMKAILADPRVPRELDFGFLDDYLSFGYGLHPRTAYRHIRILPAAHYLAIEAGDLSSVRIERYWHPPQEVDYTLTEEEWVEALREALGYSIEIHMRSDVPYGALLSGGLDSSTVVALMAQRSEQPVKTFSIGFPEQGVSELPYARQIARKYGTDHRERIVAPVDIDIVEHLVRHFDEPFADCSALPTYFVSELAREEVKVVLSGDGGDELFGGYNKYTRTLGMAGWDRVPVGFRKLFLRGLARVWPQSLVGKGWLTRAALDENARFLQDGIFFNESDKREMLQPHIYAHLKQENQGPNAFLSFLSAHSEVDPLTRFALGDLHYYLVDDILQKVDRCSMAHSLEVRVPLLDHKVVELAFRMPASMKIRNGTKKYVLRKAFGELLTPGVLSHRKQGFFAPIQQWFRRDLAGYVTSRLLGSDSATKRIIRPEYVERLVRAHQRGFRNLSERIWCLLVLEEWVRQNPIL